MKYNVNNPNYSSTVSTFLTRGGDGFKSKSGYFQRGDVITINKINDGGWTEFASSSGSTIGSLFESAKGSAPKGMDSFIVSKVNKNSASGFVIESIGNHGSGTGGDGQLYSTSTVGNNVVEITLGDTTATAGDCTVNIHNTFNGFQTDDKYRMFMQLYHFSGGTWTPLFYGGTQGDPGTMSEPMALQDTIDRSSVETAGAPTTVTYDWSSDISFTSDDQYVLVVNTYLERGETGNWVDNGTGSTTIYMDYSQTAITTPDDWTVSLYISDAFGRSMPLTNPEAVGTAGRVSENLTNTQADGGSFAWGPIFMDNYQDDGTGTYPDADTSDGYSWTNTANTGLTKMNMGVWDMLLGQDNDGATVPTGEFTITAIVDNAVGALGDSKTFNIKNVGEVITPVAQDYNYGTDMDVKIYRHNAAVSASATVSLLFERTDQIGEFYSHADLINVTYAVDGGESFMTIAGIGLNDELKKLDSTLTPPGELNPGGDIGIMSSYPQNAYSALFQTKASAWNGAAPLPSFDYRLWVIWDLDGDNGYGTTTVAGDSTGATAVHNLGLEAFQMSEAFTIKQDYTGIQLASIPDKFVGDTVTIEWDSVQ